MKKVKIVLYHIIFKNYSFLVFCIVKHTKMCKYSFNFYREPTEFDGL